MVESSTYGSGEGSGWATGRSYSTIPAHVKTADARAIARHLRLYPVFLDSM